MNRAMGGGAPLLPNVRAVLRNEKTGQKQVFLAENLVTDDGDAYYARLGCGSAAPWNVVGIRLGTATATPVKGSHDVGGFVAGGTKAVDANYPCNSDPDTDNAAYASADSVTWRFSFGTGDANINNIAEGAIVDSLSSPTKCVCHFKFAAAFSKTSSDTLKVFVNHQFLGS